MDLLTVRVDIYDGIKKRIGYLGNSKQNLKNGHKKLMEILMPYIISSVVKNLDKRDAPSIMAIVVIGMYLGQFSSPIISSFFIKTFRIQIIKFPYVIAVVAIILILILTIFENLNKKSYVLTN